MNHDAAQQEACEAGAPVLLRWLGRRSFACDIGESIALLRRLQVGVALLDGRGRVLAVDGPARGILDLDATLVLPHSERGRAIELLLTRIGASEASALGDSRAVAAAFVRDVEDRGVPTIEVLQRLYELTAAEARVAVALAGGASLDEISRKLRIARDTARNHLKQIFSKTDTHRQAQLVSLLLRGARRRPEAESR